MNMYVRSWACSNPYIIRRRLVFNIVGIFENLNDLMSCGHALHQWIIVDQVWALCWGRNAFINEKWQRNWHGCVSSILVLIIGRLILTPPQEHKSRWKPLSTHSVHRKTSVSFWLFRFWTRFARESWYIQYVFDSSENFRPAFSSFAARCFSSIMKISSYLSTLAVTVSTLTISATAMALPDPLRLTMVVDVENADPIVPAPQTVTSSQIPMPDAGILDKLISHRARPFGNPSYVGGKFRTVDSDVFDCAV